MTLTQMQYFATVCQYQNISMAAKMLYISQPALSSSLSDLEREVGFKLFDRKSKGIQPTEEGLLFLKNVDAVLKRFDLLQREIPLISRNQNTIKVGFRPFAGENEFLRVYKDFEQQHQDVLLHVNEMSNNTPSIYLDEGQIDFLVTASSMMPPDWKNKYEYHFIGEEHVQLYCHAQCPLSGKNIISPEEFAQYPLAIWEGQPLLVTRLSSVFSQAGLTLNIAAMLPQISGILQFICHNLAIGFLTGDYLHSISSINSIPLPMIGGEPILDPTARVYVFWKKEIERFRVKKLFIDYVRSL